MKTPFLAAPNINGRGGYTVYHGVRNSISNDISEGVGDGFGNDVGEGVSDGIGLRQIALLGFL